MQGGVSLYIGITFVFGFRGTDPISWVLKSSVQWPAKFGSGHQTSRAFPSHNKTDNVRVSLRHVRATSHNKTDNVRVSLRLVRATIFAVENE
jgi:hypothetical protein